MRVGGPYSVTVAYTGTGTAAFAPETVENVEINLGVATDLNIDVKHDRGHRDGDGHGADRHRVQLGRTGAATAVRREEIATLPTITGRLGDVTRLTPQASGNNFAGQGDRGNNITVDGSYFNNSFGSRARPASALASLRYRWKRSNRSR